jgi:threonine dehydratase
VRPEVKVIGVQTDRLRRHAAVGAGRQARDAADVGLFSDGTAVKLVGEETFRLARALVDDFVVVDTDAVCAAIKDVFQDTRSILEPAGALGVAAIKQYVETHKLQGPDLRGHHLRRQHELRPPALRRRARRVRRAARGLFAVTIPEERGSFKRFCALMGPRAVTEFNYRISDERVAHVFVGLAISRRDEAERIARSSSKQGFATVDLTDDELAKEHVRHMVGGAASWRATSGCSASVPRAAGRADALPDAMHPGWNISLFHYRNQGADYGRILVGIQVPRGDDAAFDAFLRTLAYPFVEETDNPVYRLFLR